ncbi:MAG: hypothetical protein JWN78_3023 [Bacteroidota bacterium]|nr:hypothetical protein [Bacteroidota bacterium]
MDITKNAGFVQADLSKQISLSPATKQAAVVKEKNLGLDVVRTTAILIVVLVHMNLCLYNIHVTDTLLYLPDGVGVFFVLSGYLIGGILINTIQVNGSGKKELFKFWWMRWFRTLPNYFLFTMIVFLLFNHGHIKLVNLFFLQNFYKTRNEIYVETWSLSVEEWFYLLFPVILFILCAISKNLKRSILITIGVFCIAGFCTKYYYITQYLKITFYNMKLHDLKWFEIKTLVVNRMDCISIGVLGAYLKYYYPSFWKKYKRIFAVLGISIIIVYTIIENKLFHNIPITKNPFFWSGFYLAYSIGVLLLLPAIEDIVIKNKLVNHFFSHTSKISYSMYLIHLTLLKILGLLFSALKFSSDALSIIFILFVYIVLLYILCNFIYKYFEKRFIDYRVSFIAKYFK